VASFAHADIVKLLNEISRRPISRSAHHQEFKNRINNATKNDIWRRQNFKTLVERNAVELGLELKCTKCSSWSWYSLKQLDYQMNCSLCLRQFRFPIIDPSAGSNSRWAYRLIGPFALPRYANGGYAASLSIRFFAEIVGKHDLADVTWSAGQELELAPKDKVEGPANMLPSYIPIQARSDVKGEGHMMALFAPCLPKEAIDLMIRRPTKELIQRRAVWFPIVVAQVIPPASNRCIL